MSETVHYKGTLKPLYISCKDFVKQYQVKDHLEERKQLLSGDEEYEEFFYDWIAEDKYTLVEGMIYEVSMESFEPWDDIFRGSIKNTGEIDFEVKYYNGGCGFHDAIDKAIKDVRKSL